MSSQDDIFQANDLDAIKEQLFGKELKKIQAQDLFEKTKKKEDEIDKAEAHRSIISKNQRSYIKRQIRKGKRSVTVHINDDLMVKLDTEVGYETNRSDKFEQILEFFFKWKDKVE